MKSVSVFLDITKFADILPEKTLMSAELKGCVT